MSKRLRSFQNAARGWKKAFLSETNFRLHILAAIVVIAVSFLLDIDALEWVAIVICIGAVLACELMNTSIESICDIVSPGFDKRIGGIKDISAGAVLAVSCAALLTGLIIFIPKIKHLFQ